MPPLLTKTRSEPAWSAACSRLDDYLRALHLADATQRGQIISQLAERATAAAAQNPDLDPTRLLMREFRTAVDQWFARIHPSCELTASVGLITWYALEPAERGAGAFLTANIPADLQLRLRAPSVRPVPGMKISSMVPLPLAKPWLEAVDLPLRFRRLAREWGRKLPRDMASALASIPVWFGVRLH